MGRAGICSAVYVGVYGMDGSDVATTAHIYLYHMYLQRVSIVVRGFIVQLYNAPSLPADINYPHLGVPA